MLNIATNRINLLILLKAACCHGSMYVGGCDNVDKEEKTYMNLSDAWFN